MSEGISKPERLDQSEAERKPQDIIVELISSKGAEIDVSELDKVMKSAGTIEMAQLTTAARLAREKADELLNIIREELERREEPKRKAA